MAIGSVIASIAGSLISGVASVGVAALREHGATKRQSMTNEHNNPFPHLSALRRMM